MSAIPDLVHDNLEKVISSSLGCPLAFWIAVSEGFEGRELEIPEREPADTPDYEKRFLMCPVCCGMYVGHRWELMCPWCEPRHEFY